MKLTVYEYAKCGTCRKAVKWLKEQGHELELIPIFDTPPSASELKRLVQASGLELKKFFNVSGEVYKAMNLKDKLPTMTEEERIELLASNGRLLKRPIVTDGKRVTVGFKEETYQEAWAAASVH
ncbi:arsenate reductase family protein [Paenibacillus marinisediminis]